MDLDQYYLLYNLDWMKKGIRNADAISHMLRLASTRTTKNKLEVAKKER